MFLSLTMGNPNFLQRPRVIKLGSRTLNTNNYNLATSGKTYLKVVKTLLVQVAKNNYNIKKTPALQKAKNIEILSKSKC